MYLSPDLEPYGSLCNSGFGVRCRLCFGLHLGPFCCFVVRASLVARPPLGVSLPSCSFFADGSLEGLEVVLLVEAVLVEVPLVVAMGSSDRHRVVHVVAEFCLVLLCFG